MNELITVIVPVYNVEKYLSKCLESICKQTYSNLEILVVNDGSTDKSGEICEHYSTNDTRIKVIHRENGGLSAARNTALNCMTGNYVLFVDSDDYIEYNAIEVLYNTLKENNSDISICAYDYVDEEGVVLNTKKNSNELFVMDTNESLYHLLDNKRITSSAWGKLYKSSLFSDIRFPEGRIYEDIPTTYKTFLLSEKIVYTSARLYKYLYRASSISKQSFSIRKMDALEFVEQMVDEVVSIYPDLKDIAICRKFDVYIKIIEWINWDKYWNEITNEVYKRIKLTRKNILLYKNSGLRRKIIALLAFLGKTVLSFFIKMKSKVRNR